ncbi:MAG TPA: energy transducer TonB [Sphingomicrobium sp.]|jgi:protein TonB|nr:energy transducer TonB [Sphingomicrobium sp.]
MPYAADRNDRAKAAVLVVALHVALGFALVLGLAGGPLGTIDRDVATLDLQAPPPPQIPPEPPPQPEAAAAREEAGAPALRAQPAPIVAPDPSVVLPLPSPVRTSDQRGPVEGADRTVGAASAPGIGRGAGGEGSGFGGGGSGGTGAGEGSGLGNPPRLLGGNRGRLPSSFLMALGIPRGQASLLLTVASSGRVTDCRVTATSGDPTLDAELCRIMLANSRWEPARDQSGRPITVQVGYTSTWTI